MSQLYVTWPRVTGTYWECTYTITMPLSTPCSLFSPIITSVPHDKSAVLHSYNETGSAQPIMAYASRSLNLIPTIFSLFYPTVRRHPITHPPIHPLCGFIYHSRTYISILWTLSV